MSYSAAPATVCTVDPGSGALALVDAGECVVTVTAASTADYNEASAAFTVTVQPTATLVLNVPAIATDNTINIAEKASGFAIAGDTGTETGVTVTVGIGAITLTATSADDAGTAAWSVGVPADAAYITGTSVAVSVSAAKTGFSAPDDVARTLTVDLVAPTAPGYTAPESLTVGVPMEAMNPSGGSGIDAYSAEGLPSGLSIDPGTGAIGGTPDTAEAGTADATVTVTDTAGNTDTVTVAFPAVARRDQTLVGFGYGTASVTFGSIAPTVTPPTGAQTGLSYSAAPATVCTVDTATGELTIVGVGACAVTATAAGTGEYNEATATYTVTVRENNAPVFPAELPVMLEVAENTAVDTAIGPPPAATDEDGHALAYTVQGVDADSFAVDPESGQLRTRAALDHETRTRYSVTVTADDGHGGTAGFAAVVTVTDVDEQPGTPEAPTVLAARGSTTSLSLRWRVPERNGGPAITGYEVQYRAGTTGAWSNHRHIGTDTRATIARLAAATQHQARVRALNGEAPGEWSEPGSGNTGQPDNSAPAFDAALPTTLTVDENTDAGAELGAPFTATDSDGDTLTYLLEGADRHAFAIDSLGQLRTRAALDHESKRRYSLTVRADDGNGGRDGIALTVSVADIDEQAGTPVAPAVLAARGSTTSLGVNWSAPDINGGPAIAGYEVQYRAVADTGTETATETNTDTATETATGEEGPWLTHRHRGAGTRTAIAYLEPSTAYQARVRALNREIPGEWSEPGAGSTGEPVNSPPVFDDGLPVEVTVDEHTAADIDIGAPFAATDTDGDALTYRLDGADRRVFAIDPESGQLRTRAALDHEAKPRYFLTVRADDGKGGADAIRVRVGVADLDEQAPPLSAPGVLATADSTTGLDLHWTAPRRNGGPSVTGYAVQYREGTEGEWIEHEHEGAETRASIADLVAATEYQARVRALNGEIPGEWSAPGAGRTGRAVNSVPVFDAGLPATLTVDENTGADTDIGAPFAAADTDGDTLTWLLDGPDRPAFAIDADSGQLRTRAALDHEAGGSRSLSVRVSDGAGGAAALAVTVNVADVEEQPAQPSPPLVLATAGTTMSLDVRWRAPDAGGGPPVTGYEVQYREGTEGEWIDHGHEGAETRTAIEELAVSADYQARVRALNGEAPGEWSEPGAGSTGREDNNPPEFADERATRSVPEDSGRREPVGAPLTAVDMDRDSLTYTLDGDDAASFDIDPQTGQILTRAVLDYETKPSHAVTVTASDGQGGADTVEVAIELIDTQEQQAALGPEAPTGVTMSRSLSLDANNTVQTEIALRWNAPEPEDPEDASDELSDGTSDGTSDEPSDEAMEEAMEDTSWFEFRLGRYPESYNGLAPAPFQCAGNRPFEPDGWRRIPDSGPDGANARSYRFDAQALGCYVLPDTFELRAQVRAVTSGEEGMTPRVSAPSTEARMRDEAPRVVGLWLDAVDVDTFEADDDLVFVMAFTEPVRVAAADGSPTLGIGFGEETRQAAFAAASKPPAFRNYGSGHIGSRLEFRYRVQEGDDLSGGIFVPADAISISGGATIVDATGPGGHAANLRNPLTTISEGSTVLARSPEEALTAGFEPDSVPEAHDGETAFSVQVGFGEPGSTDGTAGDDGTAQTDGAGQTDGPAQDDPPATETPPDLDGLTLSASSFLVTGGRITDVSRLEAGDNQYWVVGIEPDSKADVSISLGPTFDCAGEGAVCTGDGRRLANNIHAVVKGPPGLGVADARVAEGPDATMDFAVTLGRALTEAVSVDFATAEGTATPGEDYTETSGTLTFEAGEISKTVAVEVLDDAHDDDGETFTLTLSNPSGGNAYLVQATATGTIQNSDPMPKAWIARFGRTVSDHVVEAIQARLRDADAPRETHFTLGGLRVDGFFARDDATQRPAGGNPAVGGGVPGTAAYPGSGLAGGVEPRTAAHAGTGSGRGLPSLRDILMGSSFFYSSADGEQENGEQNPDAPDAGGFRDWSAWGRTAATRFRGEDGPLSLDGEVSTAMLGADARWNRWLGGVVLAHSEGEGGFTHATASGGSVTSTLTSLHPYAQYRFNERTSVWGTIGYGVGDLSLTPEGAAASVDTDLSTTMAAFGGRGVLSVRTGASGSFELAVRSDAMLTETVSGASENLLGATGATSRVRLTLEGKGSLPLGGGVLTPTLEAGLRYDGGDAETGAGLEVGGGLAYSAGRVSVEVNARGLLAHEDAAYEELGLSGSVKWQPGEDGRGWAMDAGSSWGATASGVNALWSRRDASGMARGAGMDAAQRFHVELGYGLRGRKGRALWVPFLGTEASAGQRALRMGVKLTSGPNLEAGLEIGRRTGTRGVADNAIQLQGSVRW